MTTTTVTKGATSAMSARQALPGRVRYSLCVVVAAIVLILDQATKMIAVETLAEREVVAAPLPLVEWYRLTNEDAAFGIPGLFTGMFVVVTIVVVVLIVRALPRTDRLSMALAYGLVVGGALGNGADRLFREPGFPDGGVVDFINIGFWPTFNLADTAIVTGAALLVVLLLRADREAQQREKAAAERESVRPPAGSPQDGRRAGEGSGGHGPGAADVEGAAADERR